MSNIHPNLKQLSNSSNALLHGCPRRYELYKMSPRSAFDDDENEDTDFGSLVGIGVQEYFMTGSIELAYFKMLLSWKKAIDDEDGLSKKKTFWFALQAVSNFVSLRNSVFANYDIAQLRGRPACELGFSVDCGDGFTYRGFIDAVLINRMNGDLAVLELKTTSIRPHEAMYKNSGQALGYGLIMDAVCAELGVESKAEFKVHYAVYYSNGMKWEYMPFQKSRTQRALWIKNLLLDKHRVMGYAEDSYFPMHGEYCLAFFKPCKWFGVCELSNKVLIGENVEDRVEDESKYDYKFDIISLIEQQLASHS